MKKIIKLCSVGTDEDKEAISLLDEKGINFTIVPLPAEEKEEKTPILEWGHLKFRGIKEVKRFIKEYWDEKKIEEIEMNESLEIALSYNYLIEIRPMNKRGETSYFASIPQLGRFSFRGEGKTILEAIQDLEEVKREIFLSQIRQKIKIPLPEIE